MGFTKLFNMYYKKGLYLFQKKIIFLFFVLICTRSICYASDIIITNLLCDGLTNPLGLNNTNPSFSWQIKSQVSGCLQISYKILVASMPSKLNSANADVWKSGKVSSANSVWIKYVGKNLSSRNKYYWKVIVWSNLSRDSIESGTNYFNIGLQDNADWKAKWIGLDTFFLWDKPFDFHSKLSARYFRKEFRVKGMIKKATAYVTGLGLYKFYINGKIIGTQVLAPTTTDYSKRVYYNTFDVTNKLNSKQNALGIVLGNGRFFSMRPGEAGVVKEDIPTITNFGFPKLLLQLEIEYTNGNKEIIVSDKSWKVTADGPIRANNEYDGETYDATRELIGWSENYYNESSWLPVDNATAPVGKLIAQPNPNMEIMQMLKPVSLRKKSNGKYIVDMGQNMVGWVHLQMKGKRNNEVKLRFAERLNDSGNLYIANLRNAEVTDRYIMKGQVAGESWEPSFVYHGFQYVEIVGLDSISISDIQGKVIYDKMENSGTFESSNLILNKIFKNAWWTISGNYKGMPVDCPQRDERMGWLGDRSINSVGESFLFNNYHVYAKWLDDIKDAQLENGSIPDVAPSYWWRFYSDNMTWPSTYLFAADMIYRQFGNKEIIVKHYPSMKKWIKYMEQYLSEDLIMTKDSYGDWCVPPESNELIFSKDSTRKTPGDFIASAYYFKCLTMMAQFAEIAGYNDEENRYLEFADKVLAAINNRFLNKVGSYYANNTTTSNLLALSFSMPPKNKRSEIAANIDKTIREKFDSHLSTGLIGNQWLMRGLSNNGYSDLAFTIATNTTYPSWGYMIENGANTIWELWNGNTANPAMNSGNHVMLLGDLLIWYYENLAGIKSIEPGFKKIEMKPFFSGKIDFVKASHSSPYGNIGSNWIKQNNKIVWEISVPANTLANAYFPCEEIMSIKINGKNPEEIKSVHLIKKQPGYFVFELGSGDYHCVFTK